MKVNINGNVLLQNMVFWSEKTDENCIEMATTDGKLDVEQALTNMIEGDFAIEFNKEVIEGLKNLGADE